MKQEEALLKAKETLTMVHAEKLMPYGVAVLGEDSQYGLCCAVVRWNGYQTRHMGNPGNVRAIWNNLPERG